MNKACGNKCDEERSQTCAGSPSNLINQLLLAFSYSGVASDWLEWMNIEQRSTHNPENLQPRLFIASVTTTEKTPTVTVGYCV